MCSGDISKKDERPPRPEILSFVTPIFVILVPIKDSFVIHLKSDKFIFVLTPLKYLLLG